MGVKLGQKWAVKDGNLLASNQVGSRFFNKEFDFSRASNGTYVDRDGLLKTAELYNLMPYSEDFSQWTTQSGITLEQTTETYDPNGQYNAYKVISTNPSSGFYRTGLSMNFDVTRSIYLKGVNGGETCQFKDGSGNGGLLNLTLTNEWVRYEFTTLYSGGTFQGMFIDDISSDIYVYGAQLVEGTEPLAYQYTNGLQGLPRISFEDGVGHLLLEPQRSNLLTWSSDYTQSAWNLNTEINILSNNANSPDGNLNASKIIPTINNVSHYVSRSSQSIIGHTYSVFAKADGYDWILLTSHTTSAPATRGTYFNVKNGTIGTIGTVTQNAKIEDYGNGWYRCSIDEGSSPSSLFSVHIVNENDGLAFSGDGIKGVLLWGAQRESGSYPTSVIETTTTSVTRLADVCNNSGSAQDFNNEGVLYAEIAALTDGDINRNLSITDGTFDNIVVLRLTNQVGRVQGFLKSGGGTTYSLSILGQNQNDNNKIALVYKASEFSMWLNGSKVSTTTPTAMPIGLNTLGFDWVGSGNFYGKVRNVQVFTEALSDAQLQQLTT